MIKCIYLLMITAFFGSSAGAAEVKVTFFGQIVELSELTDKCKFYLEGFFVKNPCLNVNINILNSSGYSNEDKYKSVSVMSWHTQLARYSIVTFNYK
ncbi:hypothetical protein H9I30_16790 [Morganella morganii]|uniref:hypothetical protein n=1 Tax=Morganella morganii TaxID=582 RepID=UPI0016514618|nr:hypothetical protein [Morganella morganii]MBC6659654.1 hypothetical protein [Morganella morganii]